MTLQDVKTQAPIEPGFYRYSGGGQLMIFVLTPQGQWRVITEYGTIADCHWSYIEQALGVWNLVRITSEVEG